MTSLAGIKMRNLAHYGRAHNIYLTSHQESTLLFVSVLKNGVGEVAFFSVLSIVLEIGENLGSHLAMTSFIVVSNNPTSSLMIIVAQISFHFLKWWITHFCHIRPEGKGICQIT